MLQKMDYSIPCNTQIKKGYINLVLPKRYKKWATQSHATHKSKKATLISYCQNATKNGLLNPMQHTNKSTKAGIQTQSLHHFQKICPIQAGMQKKVKHRCNTSPFKTTANTPQDRHGDVSGWKWVELEREMSVGSSYLAGCLVKSLNGYGDLLCFR